MLAKILMRKPPLTSTAPAMEVTLVPSLAQAIEASGATGEEAQRHRISTFLIFYCSTSKCEHAEETWLQMVKALLFSYKFIGDKTKNLQDIIIFICSLWT